MPELPEVETIRTALEPFLAGRTFSAVRISDTRPIQKLSPDEFCSGLIGRRVTGLGRRGKYLILNLSDGGSLIIHLRMTGALLWDPAGEEPFTRLEFFFEGGGRLVYTDVRRFGTMYLVADAEEVVGKLGVEPLSSSFTNRSLAEMLKARSLPVKSSLLSQEHIAGIGNMYADEALFAAGIHPQQPADTLTTAQVKGLHRAIRDVLKKGIKNRGASVRNYRGPDGSQGQAHKEFCVAHLEGQPCPDCGVPIKRIVVGQRGTYYCPRCQRLKKERRLK